LGAAVADQRHATIADSCPPEGQPHQIEQEKESEINE